MSSSNEQYSMELFNAQDEEITISFSDSDSIPPPSLQNSSICPRVMNRLRSLPIIHNAYLLFNYLQQNPIKFLFTFTSLPFIISTIILSVQLTNYKLNANKATCYSETEKKDQSTIYSNISSHSMV